MRLVRCLVLTLREQPFVEAAVAVGTRLPAILLRHILPNTLAPLMVQATYVSASAVLTEAVLSFLGAGTPPQHAELGQHDGRGAQLRSRSPATSSCSPASSWRSRCSRSTCSGDGLRDALDPRLARQM